MVGPAEMLLLHPLGRVSELPDACVMMSAFYFRTYFCAVCLMPLPVLVVGVTISKQDDGRFEVSSKSVRDGRFDFFEFRRVVREIVLLDWLGRVSQPLRACDVAFCLVSHPVGMVWFTAARIPKGEEVL